MTENQKLLDWVEEVKRRCNPDQVHWCDGSDSENEKMCSLMLESGTALKLDEKPK